MIVLSAFLRGHGRLPSTVSLFGHGTGLELLVFSLAGSQLAAFMRLTYTSRERQTKEPS